MGATQALRSALRDFSARPAPDASPRPTLVPVQAAPALPVPDIDALIANAVAEAEAALGERLAAEYGAELAALRAEHEAVLVARDAQFGAQALGAIGQAVAALGEGVAEAVGGRVARILAPLLHEAQQTQAISALRTAILHSVGGPDGVALVLRGPAALRTQIEPELLDAGFTVRWEDAPGFDVEASAGDTVWRTRLDEWQAGLDAALEGVST